MTIDDKYIKLLGLHIYNKILDKYGHIVSINLSAGLGYDLISFDVYYDTFDTSHMTFWEDFIKGDMQFVLFDEHKEFQDIYIQQIQESFGEQYKDDMILHISEEVKRKKDQEHKKANTEMLHRDLIQLDNISVDILADDFYSRELYKKYKERVITKEEMLYGIINHLAKEMKRIKDSNFNYFSKYVFPKEIEEYVK